MSTGAIVEGKALRTCHHEAHAITNDSVHHHVCTLCYKGCQDEHAVVPWNILGIQHMLTKLYHAWHQLHVIEGLHATRM